MPNQRLLPFPYPKPQVPGKEPTSCTKSAWYVFLRAATAALRCRLGSAAQWATSWVYGSCGEQIANQEPVNDFMRTQHGPKQIAV